ncbi:hypothetical protein [Dyadobacter sp. 32]|uniref:hypothetical protein n=1 Tax=Dyadobacter sp. 32 TaxID=538966 RepID=UPI0011EDD864
MLFKQKDLEGIKAGNITLSFRNWKKLSVNVGSEIKTTVGVVKIGSIREVKLEDITDEEAKAAGFASAKSLTGLLASQKEGKIYKIAVTYLQEDPRIELREQNVITEEEFNEIRKALENLDKFSKVGKWTIKTLQAIRENPKMKSADLAVITKKEKEWLKLNVRKLKGLGLTISHEPGYSLSPRGEVYLSIIGK